MKKLTFFAQAIGVALAFGMLPAAHGAATMQILLDGNVVLTCADGDACDLDGDAGVVLVNDEFGVYDLTAIAGFSKPEVSGDPLMDLSFAVSIDGASDDDLAILFSDTDFLLQGSLTADIGGTINGATNEVVAAVACDDGNALFTASSLALLGPFTGNGGFGDSTALTPTCTAPYSATLAVGIDANEEGVISGDLALTLQVPTPGTLALIGAGLFGFAAIRRRRQK